jgi:hypothetical protein
MFFKRSWKITVLVVVASLAGASALAVPIIFLISPDSPVGIPLFFFCIFVASVLLIPYVLIARIDEIEKVFAVFGLVLIVCGASLSMSHLSMLDGGGAAIMAGALFVTMSTDNQLSQVGLAFLFIVIGVFDIFTLIDRFVGPLVVATLLVFAVRLVVHSKSNRRLGVAGAVSIALLMPFYLMPAFGASSNQLWPLLGWYMGVGGVSLTGLLAYLSLGAEPPFDKALALIDKTQKCPNCGGDTPSFFHLCGFCGKELRDHNSDTSTVVELRDRKQLW